jgi:phosphoribosylanthranilate isomerase
MADVRVKICGICSAEDARAAEELGAGYLGMILSQGFGRSLLPDQAVDIALNVDKPVVAVLVDESVDEAQRIAALVGASVIQLHGDESPAFVQELRARGDWAIWKAVRVRKLEDVARAVSEYEALVDGLLLDAWHPELPGGGGVSFAWDNFSSVRDIFPSGLELIAAGGLTPDNVARAVRVLAPDVVDVSSGVELSPRLKDHDRIQAFVVNARTQDTAVPDTEQR